MDKRGNLKRNLLVIAISITVIFGAIVFVDAVTSPAAINPFFVNVTLPNGSALAAYTHGNGTECHSTAKGYAVDEGNWNGSTTVNEGFMLTNESDVRAMIGGTTTFWVNVSASPIGTNNQSNLTGYTYVEMYYVTISEGEAAPWAIATNNTAALDLRGVRNPMNGGSGNMTIVGESIGDNEGNIAASCVDPVTGGFVCGDVSNKYIAGYGTYGSGETWINNSDNYTRLFYIEWDTAHAFANFPSACARRVWISAAVWNSTNPAANGNTSWINGSENPAGYGIWVNVDNKAPDVYAANGTTVATNTYNKTDEDADGLGVTELTANFTITFNNTHINDTLFGPSNLNEVWVRIRSAGTAEGAGNNMTIYPDNGTDGLTETLWDATVDVSSNNSYTAPGKHWIYWCANDTINNVNCTKFAQPMYFLSINATQLEEQVTVNTLGYNFRLNISHVNGSPYVVGSNGYDAPATNRFATNGSSYNILNITGNDGQTRSNEFTGSPGGVAIWWEAYNFSYRFPDYGEHIDILGLKLNSSLANTLHQINETNITEGLSQIETAVATNTSNEVTGINSYWINVPLLPGTNEQKKNYFLMGQIEFNNTYNSVFNCSVPNGVWTCTEMYGCNGTPTEFPNATVGTWTYLNNTGMTGGESSVLSQNTSCYGVGNTGTIIFTSHFSGFAVGNDLQAPTIWLTLESAEIRSSQDVDISCTASDYYDVSHFTIYAAGHIIKECNGSDYVSSCSVTYSPSSTGTKEINCHATDRHGNVGEATTDLVVKNMAATPVGAGAATPSKVVSTHFTEGEEKTVDIGADTGIDSIDLKLTTDKSDVKITTTALEAKPATTNSLSTSKIVRYISINTENLAASDIDTAKIGFTVKPSILNSLGLDSDKVALYRYVGEEWNELSTTVVSETATAVQYEATTPGFSTFAVAEKGATTISGTATTPAAATETPTYIWYIVGAAVLIAIGLLVYYLYYKKR